MEYSLNSMRGGTASRTRTADVFTGDSNTKFSDFNLRPEILRGLSEMGITRPSPVQLQSIPLGLLGTDMITQAKSGTGKTCVFCTITLNTIDLQNLCPQTLILSPTREIAVQIRDVLRTIGNHMDGLECHAFIGGLRMEQDKNNLRFGCQVAIGTPGRVRQLLQKDILRANSVNMLIMDEADQLFQDNFRACILGILSLLPPRKQFMAFSATFLDDNEEVIRRHMNDPIKIFLDKDKPSLEGVKQYFWDIEAHTLAEPAKLQSGKPDWFRTKVTALLSLLDRIPFHQCVVFSNNKFRGQDLSETLSDNGWPSAAISSDHPQSVRLAAMEKLRSFLIRVLVSSDLTSRGIDIERVTLVINLDIPYDAETYLHRIGRTGRFGTLGVAITFVTQREKVKLDNYIKILKSNISELPEDIPIDYFSKLTSKAELKAFEKLKRKRERVTSTGTKVIKTLPQPTELVESFARGRVVEKENAGVKSSASQVNAANHFQVISRLKELEQEPTPPKRGVLPEDTKTPKQTPQSCEEGDQLAEICPERKNKGLQVLRFEKVAGLEIGDCPTASRRVEVDTSDEQQNALTEAWKAVQAEQARLRSERRKFEAEQKSEREAPQLPVRCRQSSWVPTASQREAVMTRALEAARRHHVLYH